MCLSPLRIKNRSKHYTADGMQQRWLYVPCGHCAECLEQKRRQWYLRNYYHCKECYDNNGFVLFDTLTHDDAHLPYIGDFLPYIAEKAYKAAMAYEPEVGQTKEQICFKRKKIYESINFPCFDKHDIDCFMKNLRIRLERYGYDVDDNLDYFYSSEYGSDDEYIDDRGHKRKATFRPHYHFLFYCRVPYLTPDALAYFIYDVWKRGYTDCVHDGKLRRGYMYSHNVFGKGYSRNDDLSLRKVSNYVAKYVTKEPEYKSKVDERISSVVSDLWNDVYGYVGDEHTDSCYLKKFHGKELREATECADAFRDYVARKVGMFHNQSQGFGKYALKFPANVLSIMYEGVVRMPDEQRVVADIPVPLYYVRKLYCRLMQPMKGHYQWIWTLKGKKYLKLRAERSIKFLSIKYYESFLNMSKDSQRFILNLLDDGSHPFMLHLDWWQGRFRELAEYHLFRRDRFAPVNAPVNIATAVKGSFEYKPYGKIYPYPFMQDDDGDLWKLSDTEIYESVPYVIGDFEWCDNSDFGLFERFMDKANVCCVPYRYERVPSYEESRYLCSDFNLDTVLGEFERYFSVPNAKKQEVFDKKEYLQKQFSK